MNEDAFQLQLGHFVEEVATLLETEGLPRMVGRVFGALLVCEPRHQSSEQLASTLHASRGAISTSTRALLQVGLIRQQRIPGSRATYFEVPEDAVDRLMQGSIARILIGRRVLEGGLELIASDPTRDPKRLENFIAVYDFMETEFPALLERWEAHKEQS